MSYVPPRRSVPHKAAIVGFICAGKPSVGSPFERQGMLAVPAGYRRFGMIALQVQGDSMTLPDGSGIPDGAYVLVDTKQELSRDGYVFAFRLEDGEYVAKRLRLYQGRPAMYSDNPTYDPVPIGRGVERMGEIYAFSTNGVDFTRVEYRTWH